MLLKSPKQFVFIFILVLFFSGCMSTKQLTEIIKSKIESRMPETKFYNTNNLTLKMDSLVESDSLVNVKKDNSFFIPAIVFWVWKNSMSCEIRSQYFANVFAGILQEKAVEFQLQKHLGDKRLEISLEKVPSRFVYSNSGNVIYGLVFYTYNFSETVYPDEQTLSMSYRITKDDIELKKEKYSYNFESPYKNFKVSSYQFVEMYLEQLQLDFENKSSEFIERIIEEL